MLMVVFKNLHFLSEKTQKRPSSIDSKNQTIQQLARRGAFHREYTDVYRQNALILQWKFRSKSPCNSISKQKALQFNSIAESIYSNFFLCLGLVSYS